MTLNSIQKLAALINDLFPQLWGTIALARLGRQRSSPRASLPCELSIRACSSRQVSPGAPAWGEGSSPKKKSG